MARKGGLGPNRGKGNADYNEGAAFPWAIPDEVTQKVVNRAKTIADLYQTNTEDVNSLIEVPENYGKGPQFSTRLTKHKFIPKGGINTLIPTSNNLGTVYVLFEGTRKNGQPKGPDVYKYENVPLAIYHDFSRSNSKGAYIHKSLDRYNYTKLGGADAFPE